MKKILISTWFVFAFFWANSQLIPATFYTTKDAYTISSDLTNYGNDVQMEAGIYVNKLGTATFRRSYTEIQMSGIPADAIIVSAQLMVYQNSGLTASTSTDLYVERITSSWEESVIKAGTEPSVSSSEIVTSSSYASNWRSFDVKAHVQKMVSGNYSNIGWRIRFNNEAQTTANLYKFQTSDGANAPKLVINYYLPLKINSVVFNHCSTALSTDGSITPSFENGCGYAYTYQWMNSSGAVVGTGSSLSNVQHGWYGLYASNSTYGDHFYMAFLVGLNCQDVSINFNPGPNYIDDAYILNHSTAINSNYGVYSSVIAQTWTSGTWFEGQNLLRFKLWMDPNIITNSAILNMYGKNHSTAGRTNNAELQKVTSYWKETDVTWNLKPTFNSTILTDVPATTSTTQNTSNVNISSFWNNWKLNNNNNFGMLFKLDTYATQYARQEYYSSDETNTALRPSITFNYRAEILSAGTITAGSNAICSGSTTLLTLNSFTSGSTFQWQKSTDNVNFTTISGATSSTYTTLSSTTVNTYYRCVVSLGSCTPVISASILITIKAVPTVSVNNTSFCTGTSVTLTGEPSQGGGTFLWSTGATSASIIVSPSITTEYSVVYTLNGCASPLSRGVVSVCSSPATFNDSTELGTVSVSINEAPSKVGPYHYKISQYPNESISSVYKIFKDSLYGGDLDSATFFLGNVASTNYTFQNLNMGKHYVSVFDSRGVRVFDREILVLPTITLSNNSGISITNNIITSSSSNAYSMLDLYLSEDKIAEMGYIIMDKSKNHFMGLINSNLTDASDISNYKYGFSVKNSTLYFIEDGIEGSESYSLQSGALLELKYQDSLMSYYADGVLLKSVSTTGEFNYRSGVSFELSGVSVQVLPWNLRKKYYYFKVKNIHYYDCSGQIGGFTFNGLNSAQTSYNFNWTVEKDGVQILSGTSNGSEITVLNSSSYGPGIYTLTGIPLVSGPSFTLDVYIGVEATWTDHINYTSVTPNDYSIERTSSNLGTYSYARAENILAPNTNGWVQFNPILSSTNLGSRNILRLLPINSTSTSPIFTELGNISITKIAFIRRISWTGPTAGFANLPSNAIVRLKIVSNNVEIFVNNQQVGNFQIPASSSVLLRGHSLKPTEGFDNVVTSFDCNPKQPLSTIVYSELKREMDGGFASAVDGVLKFTFDEEYETGNTNYLPIKIYDDKHNLLVQSSIDGIITNEDGLPSVEISAAQIKYDFDDNRYELTMSNINTITNNSFYLIEVTTSTGEKRYLKVQYHN